jgi:putative flippase GtrA
MYAAILALMFVFIDIAKIGKSIAFFCVYLIAYIADYILNLKWLFHKTHSFAKIIKFILHICFFLVAGTLIFDLLVNYNVHYLSATLITAFALMPLRFLAYRFIVFR